MLNGTCLLGIWINFVWTQLYEIKELRDCLKIFALYVVRLSSELFLELHTLYLYYLFVLLLFGD